MLLTTQLYFPASSCSARSRWRLPSARTECRLPAGSCDGGKQQLRAQAPAEPSEATLPARPAGRRLDERRWGSWRGRGGDAMTAQPPVLSKDTFRGRWASPLAPLSLHFPMATRQDETPDPNLVNGGLPREVPRLEKHPICSALGPRQRCQDRGGRNRKATPQLMQRLWGFEVQWG